ncbi:MAG: hypothetical protein KJ787_14310 [Gammaproteobacteria bacterium]|nr:hypothetical protein [Gammaproteobacteria bacterium]MBU1647502.1 hypothetical protein [Gammaproteobacteria bacterium]MBU1972951.1 hypothetical protein [Gammaproteobacteria bacterium]
MRWVGAGLLLLHAAAVAAFGLSVEIDSIEHPAFAAERIVLQQEAGGARLAIGTLRIADRRFTDVRLDCREFDWSGGDWRCIGGTAKVGAGATANLDFHYAAKAKALDITLRELPAATLVSLLPDLAAWQPRGTLSGAVRLAGKRIELDLAAAAVGFGNAAGTQAGEGIILRIGGTALEAGGTWQWQADIAWQGGEVYSQPWYFKSAGQALAARGILDATQLNVEAARLTLPGIGVLDGQMRWDRQRQALSALSLNSDVWQAATAWAGFGQPLLGETPRIQPAGTVRFALAVDDVGLRSLDLDLDLDTLDVGGGRLSLAKLQASVPWRREAATAAQVTADGGKAGVVPLGPFNLALAMNGWNFGFDRFEVPLLDSRLLFEDFAARREGEKWRWQLAGAVDPVSMPSLSATLGLPRMEGLLSATIPRIRYADGTLVLDGTLIVALFDGYLSVAGLKVVEPFGRAPRVVADIDARHLDLAMLTDTFSFGSITGYVDADVRGLEMVGWQPQAFAARIETSPGDFRKRISQRAVQNISSLGGAGAGAAIQRSFLRFFETFGYDRIGLTCRLVGGVCQMGGLEDSGHGYLMVKGGGVPALNVMGYNRRVSWDVLVSRLQEIAAGNSRPVIE